MAWSVPSNDSMVGLPSTSGLQVDRPAPDELEVGQGVGRLVEAQVDPVVLVPQQQFAAVAEVAVYYIDPRFSEVRQAEQQPLLDFLELARLDDVLPGLLLVGVTRKSCAERRIPASGTCR